MAEGPRPCWPGRGAGGFQPGSTPGRRRMTPSRSVQGTDLQVGQLEQVHGVVGVLRTAPGYLLVRRTLGAGGEREY